MLKKEQGEHGVGKQRNENIEICIEGDLDIENNNSQHLTLRH
jgi:hypothetical protein